jgi:D-alanyl-D-alanine carboxypeptidase
LAEDRIRQAVTLKGVDFKTEAGDARHVPATDELLDSFLNAGDYGVVGGKTGFTDEAGYTMVLRATQGPGDIIAVILGSPTSDDRFQDAKSLLAWGFRTFEWAK